MNCVQSFIPLLTLLLFSLTQTAAFAAANVMGNSDNTAVHNQDNHALYSLINKRLEYMEAVARYKWDHNLPIEDIDREKQVVSDSIQTADGYGLKHQEVEAFFREQITMAKKIQQYYHNLWAKDKTAETTLTKEAVTKNPSLQTIRPKLIDLGNEIIASMAAHQGDQDFSAFNHMIASPALSTDDKAALFYALTQVNPKPYTTQLDRILAQKVLYVGTTGDYQPFSFYTQGSHGKNNQTLTGIDIDLARSLAQSLNATAIFIPTTWKTLSSDLASHRYDIMMGGISKKLFRQQEGLLSHAYLEGGKTPIALCSQAQRFDSLAKIDQPSTRLIVNPGGTNQRFVDEHIKRAQIIIHDSNVTIFNEILANRADVMITDKIEIDLQTHLHPQLCGTMGDKTLSYSSKAYFMERDIIWLEYVNTWLDLAIKDGTVKKVFAHYLK